VASRGRDRLVDRRRGDDLLAVAGAVGASLRGLVDPGRLLGELGRGPPGCRPRVGLHLPGFAAAGGRAPVPDPPGAAGHPRLAPAPRRGDNRSPSGHVAPVRAGRGRHGHPGPARGSGTGAGGRRQVRPGPGAVGAGAGHPVPGRGHLRSRGGSPGPGAGHVGGGRPTAPTSHRGRPPVRGRHRLQAVGPAGAAAPGDHLSAGAAMAGPRRGAGDPLRLRPVAAHHGLVPRGQGPVRRPLLPGGRPPGRLDDGVGSNRRGDAVPTAGDRRCRAPGVAAERRSTRGPARRGLRPDLHRADPVRARGLLVLPRSRAGPPRAARTAGRTDRAPNHGGRDRADALLLPVSPARGVVAGGPGR
jgi:hypothetical protein